MFDCHSHLDESIVSVEGLLASMDAGGVERTALIAALVPPISLPWFAAALLPILRGMIHRPGRVLPRIAQAIYAAGVKGDGTVDLLGRRFAVIAQPDNDTVIAAVRAHPDRFVGWAFVNPAGPVDPVAEAERCMAVPGMIGVKAHPFWHNYPVARLADCAALCEERGLPLLIHLGVGETGDFALLPKKFPKLRIVYAHAGLPYGPEVWDLVRKNPNVCVDLSCSAYVDAAAARRAVRAAGAERCLIGTDGPYFHDGGDRFDYGYLARLLDSLGLSDADRRKVAGENFAELIARR